MKLLFVPQMGCTHRLRTTDLALSYAGLRPSSIFNMTSYQQQSEEEAESSQTSGFGQQLYTGQAAGLRCE